MKNLRTKDTALARKLRALEEQAAALDSDIKNVSKSLKKSGVPAEFVSDSATRAALLERARQAASRHNPNYAASIGTGTTTSVTITDQNVEPATDEASVNLFSVETAVPPPAPPEPFATTVSETTAPAPRVRRAVQPRSEKLKNYLSSGSFGGNVPLAAEREKQRTRAIIAVIAAVTFGYIIYRALFR